jgi:hypothetical protein
VAETDFYRAVRAILQERRNSDFDRAIATVRVTLEKLEAGDNSDPERAFLVERLRALKDFFDAVDALVNAVARLDSLGLHTIQTILKILR